MVRNTKSVAAKHILRIKERMNQFLVKKQVNPLNKSTSILKEIIICLQKKQTMVLLMLLWEEN